MGRGPARFAGVTDVQLAAALWAWGRTHLGKRDTWNRSLTGRVLKSMLSASGNFKHQPRGDPSAGWAAMLEQRGRRGADARLAAAGQGP